MSNQKHAEEIKKETLDQLDELAHLLKEWTRQRRLGIAIATAVDSMEGSELLPSITKSGLMADSEAITADAITSLSNIGDLLNAQIRLIKRAFK